MKSFSKKELLNFQNIIFDLDDTIYQETDYLFECFRKIELETHILGISEYLQFTFLREGRFNLFDKCILQFALDENLKNRFLSILRTHTFENKINTFKYFIPLMQELIVLKKKVFVVTNGNITQQNNKIDNIEWHGVNKYIEFLLSNNFKPKPNPESFSFIKIKHRLKLSDTVFIGDSEVDFQYAKNVGIKFCNIKECLFFEE